MGGGQPSSLLGAVSLTGCGLRMETERAQQSRVDVLETKVWSGAEGAVLPAAACVVLRAGCGRGWGVV